MEKVIDNRLPYEYFLTTGSGDSNAGSKGLPFETGSYDAALNSAGIENSNIMEYTSVIPTHAKKLSLEEGLKRQRWGEVLECIMAKANGKKGETISAAVMITNVYKNNKFLGGFACEYSGNKDKKEIEDSLLKSVSDMIERRGYGKMKNAKVYQDNKTDKGYTIHPGKEFIYDSIKIEKDSGTVLASICFVSFKLHFRKAPKTHKKSHNTKTRKKKRSN